jgi:hypothetical protein
MSNIQSLMKKDALKERNKINHGNIIQEFLNKRYHQ